MRHSNQLVSLSLCLMASAWALPTGAETTDCGSITSLPYIITAQGIYCLTGNLSTSMTTGNAIEIQTNNVTLDLNGYKLGGLGAGDATQATGIYAYQRKNITIKNGIVRGFFVGIMLFDEPPYNTSAGNVVTDILADQNTVGGIAVYGLGNTVSHNTVVDTGGSTVSSQAGGVYVYGSGARVVNNEISTTTAQGGSLASGVFLNGANYCLVQNNTVTDTIKDTGDSYAIYIVNTNGIFLRGNNLAHADNGLYFYAGSTGKYFNNLTFDVATPFTGGIPIGPNNN